MGHLYHGYVSHNQRVYLTRDDSKSTVDRSTLDTELRGETPKPPRCSQVDKLVRGKYQDNLVTRQSGWWRVGLQLVSSFKTSKLG